MATLTSCVYSWLLLLSEYVCYCDAVWILTEVILMEGRGWGSKWRTGPGKLFSHCFVLFPCVSLQLGPWASALRLRNDLTKSLRWRGGEWLCQIWEDLTTIVAKVYMPNDFARWIVQKTEVSWAWWYTPVIPPIQEAEEKRSTWATVSKIAKLYQKSLNKKGWGYTTIVGNIALA